MSISRVPHKKKKNSYIDYTTTTLSSCLTYHHFENSAIKQHLIIQNNNSTNQLTSSDVRKILTDNTIIIYKTIIKKWLQILEAIYSNFFKKIINKIAFNTDTNILNIFDN